MNASKHIIESALLGRMAHADAFELGAAPGFLVLLFGGSGVDEEEYLRRSRTVVPVLRRVLEVVEARGVAAWVVHVTSPPDLPLNRFDREPSAARLWNAHVANELLEPWSGLPYYVAGFSGGAALALNGLHADPRCYGGAVLGGDAIPPEFTCPPDWSGPLRLYATPEDRVCHDPANRHLVEALIRRGQAEFLPLRRGGHRLADYATPDGLGDLIQVAARLAPLPPAS